MSKIYRKVVSSDRTDTLLVYYAVKSADQKQIGSAAIKGFIDTIKEKKCTEAILIVETQLSGPANSEINTIKLTRIQIFNDMELTYNPINHVDVPRHEIIPAENVNELLRQMKTDLSKVLIIRVNDPVAKMYGYRVGDLIRIHRVDDVISLLTKNSINYRVVV